MSDWVNELSLKRNAQRTNVFIISTFDQKRLAQFLSALQGGEIDKLFKQEYVKLLLWDLQRGQILDLRNMTPLPVDPMMGPVQQIDSILQNQPAILVIKYIFTQGHAQSISDALMAWSHDEQLYRKKSTVIVFSSDAGLFPTPLLRMVYSIDIVPSTGEERREILKGLASQLGEAFRARYSQDLKVEISEDLVQASSGLDLHSVETAALESFYRTEPRRFDVQVFTEYKVQILQNYGIQYILPSRGFETVGGYRYLKEYINTRIVKVLRNPEIAQHYGLEIPRGLLLYGYPGTGKTFISKAMSKEIGLPMVKISPADFMRGIVGETEARVRQITTLIESLSPVVVFIDERAISLND